MATNGGPNIIEDGLVFALDAANKKSYPGSGTTWYDLSGNSNDGTLTNGPTFDSGNNGSIQFDGVNDNVSIVSNSSININNSSSTLPEYQWTFQIIYKNLDTEDLDNQPRGTLFSLLGSGFSGFGFRYLSVENWDNTLTTVYNGDGNNFQTNQDRYVTSQPFKIRMLTLTIKGNELELMYNTETPLLSWLSTYSVTSSHIRLGTRNSNLYNGNIYSFKIYNKVLSSTEILQNYNATKDRFGL